MVGLFCELAYETPSPLSVILAKQHHLNSLEFEKIQVNDVIDIKLLVLNLILMINKYAV